MSTAAPREKTREKSRRKMTTEPPYQVVLYNDDFTPMEHVVASLCKVIPGMGVEKAARIMYTAHFEGRAIVTKCHKELAELYAEGLGAEGLTVTVEPD